MTYTLATLPTRGRRDIAADCIASVADQVDGVIVINNGSDEEGEFFSDLPGVLAVRKATMQPPNISILLNAGIDLVGEFARYFYHDEWNVALLNDDVEVYPGWVETLDAEMRATSAVLAYMNPAIGERHLYQHPNEGGPLMTGWACLFRGESRLRWDTDLHWWYSDNMFELECRLNGGVLAVPGRLPLHKHPNVQTIQSAELTAQAHLDRETFKRKMQERGF